MCPGLTFPLGALPESLSSCLQDISAASNPVCPLQFSPQLSLSDDITVHPISGPPEYWFSLSLHAMNHTTPRPGTLHLIRPYHATPDYSTPGHAILDYTAAHHATPHHTALYHIAQYQTIPHCTQAMPNYATPPHTIPHYDIPCHTIL